MASRNTIEILIKGEDLASGVIDNISKNLTDNLKSIGDGFKSAGQSLLKYTAPITAALTTAVVTAARFEEAMYNAGSILGATEDQIASLSSEILAMGTTSRAGPQAVAESYYDIVSGVADATTHMAILDAAIATSEAGNADLMGTTSALVAVMNSYKFGAEDAGFASDVMTGIVQRGVLTMDEMAAALPLVTGTANAMNLSFDELGGQFAYLTTQGYSATTSASLLNNMMATLLNPTADLTKVIADMGYESGQAMVDALGLAGAYEAIGDFSGFEGIITGQEALRGAIALTGEGADAFLANFSGQMSEAQQATYDMILATEGLGAATAYLDGLGLGFEGATAAAREIQNMTLAAQFDLIRAAVAGLWIEVGMSLIPMLKEITPNILAIVLATTEWVRENREVVQTIAKVTAVVTAIGAGLLIIGGVFSIVGSIIGTVSTIIGGIGVVLSGVGTALSVVGTVLGAIVATVGLPVLLIIGAIAAAIGGLYLAWKNNWFGIRDIAATVGAAISGFIDRARQTIEAFSLDDFVARVREGFGEVQVLATDVIGAVDDAVGGQLRGAFDRVREIFESINLGGFIESIGGANTVLRMLGGILLSMVFPPLGIVLRIIGLVQLGMKVWQDGTAKTAKNISKAFDKIGDVLGDFAETALDALGEMASAFIDWVGPQIPIVIAALGEMALGIVGWIGDIVPQILAQLYYWTGAFLRWVGPILGELLPQLGTLIGGVFEWILGTGVPMLLGGLAYLTAAFVKWAIDALPVILPALWDMLKAIGEFIVEVAPAALEGFGNIVMGIISGLLQGIGRIAGGINESVIQPIREALSNITWGDVGDFLGRMWEAIKGGVVDVGTWVSEKIITPIVEDIQTTDWGALVGDLLSLFWNSIIAIAGFAINAAAWLDQHVILPIVNDLKATDWGLLAGDLLSLFWNSLVAVVAFAIPALIWLYQHVVMPIISELRKVDWGALVGDILSLLWNALVAVISFAIDAVFWINEHITTPIVEAIQGVNWLEAVGDFLQLLWDGITGAAGFAIDAAGWVHDKIIVPIKEAISGAVGEVTGALNDLISDATGGVTSRVTVFGHNLNPFARAEGGDVMRGKSYIVGEKGPEMFIPDMSGMIVSNDQMRSAMNAMAASQTPSGMGLDFRAGLDGGGAMMAGDTYYIEVMVDPSNLERSEDVERNAEAFGDALLRKIRTT